MHVGCDFKWFCISDCGPISSLKINNTGSFKLSPTQATTYQTSALVTCGVGHVVSNMDNIQKQFHMTCGQDGKWNNLTDCVKIGIVFKPFTALTYCEK